MRARENNKNKTIFNSIKIGIKEGFKIQTVPSFLKIFDSLIWVKIFKFVGIITTSYILSSKFNLLKTYNIHNLNDEIFIISSVISISYLIYRVFYSITVVIYTIKLFKDKKHWLVNSPKDHLATVLKGGLMVLKGSTSVVGGSGLLFTVGSELDDIAEQYGRKRVIIPAINSTLEKWGVAHHVDRALDYVGFLKEPDALRKRAIADAATAWHLPEETVEKALEQEANKTISSR